MPQAATAQRRAFRHLASSLPLVLTLLTCAPHSTAPGAEARPYEGQPSGTVEPAAGSTIGTEPESGPPAAGEADAGTVAATQPPATLQVIVQATSAEAAAELVLGVGGRVTHRLDIIRAVGAELSQEQFELLEAHDEVSRIWEDREVKIESRR